MFLFSCHVRNYDHSYTIGDITGSAGTAFDSKPINPNLLSLGSRLGSVGNCGHGCALIFSVATRNRFN